MGSCSFSQKNITKNDTIRVSEYRNSNINTNHGRESQSYLNNNVRNSQNNNLNNNLSDEEKFKDMPEYEDEFSGDGIKKIKAYKCELIYDELQKLRSEFWSI
jgi:hypothetical protein